MYESIEAESLERGATRQKGSFYCSPHPCHGPSRIILFDLPQVPSDLRIQFCLFATAAANSGPECFFAEI